MTILHVKLKNRSYHIKIGRCILEQIDFSKFKSNNFAIITDSCVGNLYGKKVQSIIKKQGFRADIFEFLQGEKSKTPKTAISLGRQLAKKGFGRDTVIVALGGGIVGDVAGFVASFYMRGITYIQIPTTLLAQVDSSIGGKTGVDIPEGKNLFGTFNQPKAVFIDIDTLKTLPKQQIRNGIAEIIKYAMIYDKNLFELLEINNIDSISNIYETIIYRCCKIKSNIVAKDEKEKELRKILNYGHTIGHAIEVFEKYSVLHGYALSIGMAYEGKISVMKNILNKNDLNRQNALLTSYGLPIHLKIKDIDSLINIMKSDKKNLDGKIYFVLPKKIGDIITENSKIAIPVDSYIIKKCLL